MEALDFPFEGTEAARGRLDEEQEFAGFFYFSIPTIVGLDGAAEDVNAGGEALFYDAAGDEFCLHGISAGDKDEAVVVGSLHLSFSTKFP